MISTYENLMNEATPGFLFRVGNGALWSRDARSERCKQALRNAGKQSWIPRRTSIVHRALNASWRFVRETGLLVLIGGVYFIENFENNSGGVAVRFWRLFSEYSLAVTVVFFTALVYFAILRSAMVCRIDRRKGVFLISRGLLRKSAVSHSLNDVKRVSITQDAFSAAFRHYALSIMLKSRQQGAPIEIMGLSAREALTLQKELSL